MKFFLDIDGVLVHAIPHRQVELEHDGFYKFNPKAVEVLNQLLQLYPNHEVILSTSHRFRFTLFKWKQVFEKRGLYIRTLSIVDIKPDQNTSRKTELLNWIKLYGFNPEDILIIDDDKSLNELPDNLKRRLVLTNPYTGLISLDIIPV